MYGVTHPGVEKENPCISCSVRLLVLVVRLWSPWVIVISVISGLPVAFSGASPPGGGARCDLWRLALGSWLLLVAMPRCVVHQSGETLMRGCCTELCCVDELAWTRETSSGAAITSQCLGVIGVDLAAAGVLYNPRASTNKEQSARVPFTMALFFIARHGSHCRLLVA